MTGPAHYLEAERLLAKAQTELENASPRTINDVLMVVESAERKALVHATLALVATQAAATGSPDDWEGVIT